MELNIFELLYNEKIPISAEDLGKKNQFKPDILARLLNCLTALKVVAKTEKDGKGKLLTEDYRSYIYVKCTFYYSRNSTEI